MEFHAVFAELMRLMQGQHLCLDYSHPPPVALSSMESPDGYQIGLNCRKGAKASWGKAGEGELWVLWHTWPTRKAVGKVVNIKLEPHNEALNREVLQAPCKYQLCNLLLPNLSTEKAKHGMLSMYRYQLSCDADSCDVESTSMGGSEAIPATIFSSFISSMYQWMWLTARETQIAILLEGKSLCFVMKEQLAILRQGCHFAHYPPRRHKWWGLDHIPWCLDGRCGSELRK